MHRRSLLAAGGASLATAAIPARAQTPTRALRFVPSSNLTVLDPVFSGAYVSVCHGYAVFDALVGADAAQTPRPQMAERIETSNDGRVWTFTLRENLRFHDGEPVRPADVVASLDRWTARQAAGQIVGAYLDRWEGSGDRIVRAVLKRPMPSLATVMATTIYPPFVFPERIAKGDPARPITEMVGSGPFRFRPDEYVSGSRVVYERFDGYVPRAEPAEWTSGGKVAHLDRIEWHIIPDGATAAAALRRGEVDWVENPAADLVATLKAQANIRLGVIDPSGWTGFVRFNQLQPPFDNQAVRQAVMAALDQQDFLDVAVGGDTAAATVCKSVFPCTAGGPQAGSAAMPADLARARALLAGSGYAGERVVLLGATDIPPVGDFATIVAEAMRRIGLNVDLVSSDWGTVTQRRAKREPVAQGGWSAFISLANGPAILNPAVNFLVRGLGRTGYFGWYENAEVEALTRDWLEAASDAQRRDIAARIEAVAFRTVPEIPLGQFVRRTAYLDTIKGILQGPAVLPWNVAKG